MTRARFASGIALAALLAGCGKLQSFGGPVPPLVTFKIDVTGDLMPLLWNGETEPQALHMALVWGDQWLTEAFCVLPPESDDAAKVIAAGCRDPFAFVPLRVAANAPVIFGTTTEISLFDLPPADVMVGPTTSRVAYGTFVLYEDRDGDGTLGLSIPHRSAVADNRGPPIQDIGDSPDIVYGASFFEMTAPDTRVAFLEGMFTPSAFYPRAGCDPPASNRFSILKAGGFSLEDGLASALTGQLPPESSCGPDAVDTDMTVVTFGVQPPASVQEVTCVQRSDDSSIRYREPPANPPPDLAIRTQACAHLPTFDTNSMPSPLIQLVVSGREHDRCKGLTHYTLRGCRNDVNCALPQWDFTASPPAWWPCPQ